MPLLRRRQALRGAVRAWGLLGLLAAVLVAAPANAQAPVEPPRRIDVQQYKPGPGWKDVLGLHSPQVGRHLDWNLGLSFNYAKDPLNFLQPRTDEFVYEIVKNQFTFDLMGAIALFDRFELGVALPITSQRSAARHVRSPRAPRGRGCHGRGRPAPGAQGRTCSPPRAGCTWASRCRCCCPPRAARSSWAAVAWRAFPRLLGEWVSEGGRRVLANVGVNLQPQRAASTT